MEPANRRLRILLVVLAVGAILLAAVTLFGAEVGTFLGSTVASNVLLVALIVVDGFLGLYAILEEKSRRYFLQVKEDVLEKWEPRGNLGGVREDMGELSRTNPTDPPAFANLPPENQQKFKRTYPELWNAWELAKSKHRELNDQLERTYRELHKKTQEIRGTTPIREIDERNPEPPWLHSLHLFHAVLEGARERTKFARGVVFVDVLEDDGSIGELKSGGYILVRGSPEARHELKAKLDALLDSKEFRELASRLIRQTSEIVNSSSLKAFETELMKTISGIKWKHPGK